MRLLLFILLFFNLSVQAQEYAKWIEMAEAARAEEDFQGAVRYYQNAFSLDSSRAELQYALAEAHEANLQYKDAKLFYQRVYRKDRARYYPDGPFHIAKMCMYLGEYDDALEYLKRARRNGDDQREAQIDIAMKTCEFALLHPDDREWEIEQLGPRVNGPESDFAAFMLPDSNLLFSSLRGPYDNHLALEKPEEYHIRSYRSERSSGDWKKTYALESKFLEPEFNYVNPILDARGDWLYMSRCEDLHHCIIGRFAWKDSIASDFEVLEGEVNAGVGTQTHPFPYTENGKESLLFSSDRAGGSGGMDIWSAGELDGKWLVKNLGTKVNTAGNEISPSYDLVEGTFYFSSDALPGFGGFDVYQVSGSINDLNSGPENLGLPLNSSLNDLYFRWQGDIGFLSSNRSSAYSIDGSQCCNDLFLLKKKKTSLIEHENDSLYSSISQHVPDQIQSVKELEDLLPLSLYFHNDVPDPGSRSSITAHDYAGTLRDYMGMRQEYKEEYSIGLSPPQVTNARAQMDEFFDLSLEANMKVLDDVTALLLGELKKGKKIEIAIKGYASPLAKNDYNKLLTERRISSVIHYFSQFQQGALLSYLNPIDGESALSIKRIPYGEEQSEKSVSDNPQDRQNSVFSISAAKERRVEILRISELK